MISDATIPDIEDIRQQLSPAFERGLTYTLQDNELDAVYLSLCRLKALEEAGAARDWEMIETLCPTDVE